MVEKEGRQMAENSIPRGKAQKAAPARRKGTFYLWLAAWWPTIAGQKWLARKGRRKALTSIRRKLKLRRKSAQLSARQRTETHNNPQGNARERTRVLEKGRNTLLRRKLSRRKKYARQHFFRASTNAPQPLFFVRFLQKNYARFGRSAN